jgi:PAS domain S-box-containing protein
MRDKETGRSADGRALDEKLTEIKAERDYYRSIAEQTGRKTLGDIHNLSRIINNLRQTEELLRKSQEELEVRVAERTSELHLSNTRLQKEIVDRQLSEEKYKALSESTSDWIWEIDRDGVYVYSSPNVKEMLGYSPEEVVGKKPFDFMPGDESARIIPEFNSVVAARKAFHNLENVNVHKDGHMVILESSGVPIIDRHGVFCGYRGIDRNITDRKRMEESISRERALVKRVMETSPIGIVTWDATGRIRLANLQAEKILCLSRDRITGRAYDAYPWRIVDPAGNLFPDEDLPFRRVMSTHQPVYDMQYAIEWPEGKRVLLSINAAPLFTEAGQFDGVIESISDITDQKHMEDELLRIRKLESVGLLAGGIAHDFNNLLQGMMGNIELAKSYLLDNEPEKVAPLLDQASAVAGAASELSYRFLTFSKGGEPVKRLLSIKNIINKSEWLSLNGSKITCDYALSADLPSLDIDEGQMLQVFNNLFINAKEAMPNGGTIGIHGEIHEVSEGDVVPLAPGSYVKLSIQDTGIGIRPENLTRVFDPYFSVKGLGAKTGTGLGLAICHSIIRKHNGHIGVESEIGKGTTFHIYLPATRNMPHEKERKPKRPEKAAARNWFGA